MKKHLVASTALLTLIVGLFGMSAATAQSAEDDPAAVDAGQVVYENNCAGCHGADGTGSDRGRPLTGIAGQQADRTVHIASVTDGIGNMPAFGSALSGDEIDQVVSFVRLTFVEQEAEAETTETNDTLPVTGAETWPLAVVGVTVVAAGLMLVAYSRRESLV